MNRNGGSIYQSTLRPTTGAPHHSPGSGHHIDYGADDGGYGINDGNSPDTAVAVAIDGGGLPLETIERIARHGAPLHLTRAATTAIAASAHQLDMHARSGDRIYGLTTGVGALDQVALDQADMTLGDGHHTQARLLLGHAAAVGPAMVDDEVRAMLVCRIITLAQGLSGVQLTTVETLVAMVNAGVTPIVPCRGSVGASDLAPLAHAMLPLIGAGRARWRGRELAGDVAMQRAGIALRPLGGRDGLALINGLAQTTAVAALAVLDGERLVRAAELAGAMGAAALGVVATCFDPRSVAYKGHADSAQCATRLRALLGAVHTVGEPEAGDFREPLSLRTLHQVAGAARESLGHARAVVEAEAGAAVDNPLVAVDGWMTSNAANCDGHRIAQAADLAAGSLLSLAAASERRTARLLDPTWSRGLPAFLIPPDAPPDTTGLMIAQYTAAALVAELRTIATPSAGQSIPTCNGMEDVVSMSAIAARRLRNSIELARSVIAIELLCAARALELARVPAPSAELAAAHQAVCAEVARSVDYAPGNSPIGDDIARVTTMLARYPF